MLCVKNNIVFVIVKFSGLQVSSFLVLWIFYPNPDRDEPQKSANISKRKSINFSSASEIRCFQIRKISGIHRSHKLLFVI